MGVLNPSGKIIGAGLASGYIDGLITSNAADADHDITFAAGVARDSTNAVDMVLSSAITKRIDAGWAVGTGNGGLDTGSVANTTWYHLWLIKRSDTGVVDALFSTSATTPTMPASYDYKRRIGAVLTDGSANILGYYQIGDNFVFNVPKGDYSGNPTEGSSQTLTLSVPTGIVVLADMRVDAYHATGSVISNFIGNNLTALDPLGAVAYRTIFSGPADNILVSLRLYTNTSAQIKYWISSTYPATSLVVNTLGWTDPRGKDA